MLETVLNEAYDKCLEEWKGYALTFLTTLEEGVGKISSESPSSETEKIHRLIEKAKENKEDKTLFFQNIKEINTELKEICTHPKHADPKINNFYAQAFLNFDKLVNSNYDTYQKYTESIFNARELHQEPGRLEEMFFARLGKFTAKAIYAHLKELDFFLKNQIKDLNESRPDLEKKWEASDPLVSAFGAPYENLKSSSNIDILNKEDIKNYLNHEIVGTCFDTYYMQIANWLDVKNKAEILAVNENQSQTAFQNQKAILNQCNLFELQTEEAQQFIDEIAKQLGFKKAEDLYENFSGKNKETQFEIFKQHRAAFIEQAHNPQIRENAIENLNRIVKNEKERIKQKTESPTTMESSNAYYSNIAYLHFQFNPSLYSAQAKLSTIYNVYEDYVEGYIPNQDESWKAWFTTQAAKILSNTSQANTLKRDLFSKLLNPMDQCKSTMLYLNIINKHVLNEQWEAYILRNPETDLIVEEKDVNEAIKNYIGMQYLKEHEEDKETVRLQEKTLKNKYEAIKEKYCATQSTDIPYINLSEFNSRIDNINKKINTTENEIQSLESQISKLSTEIEKHQKKQSSFLERMAVMKDAFLGFFGIKTASKLKREEEKIEIENKKNKMQEKKYAINIKKEEKNVQVALINSLKKPYLPYENFTDQELDEKLTSCMKAYNAVFEDLSSKIHSEYGPIIIQEKLNDASVKKIEKELNLTLNLFLQSKKNEPIPNANYKQINEKITQLENLSKKITKFYIKTEKEPNIQTLLEKLDQTSHVMKAQIDSIDRADKIKIHDEAKKQINTFFSERKENIIDPFKEIGLEKNLNLSKLKEEELNDIYSEINTEYLNSIKENVSFKSIEDIYYNIRSMYYETREIKNQNKQTQALAIAYDDLSKELQEKLNEKQRTLFSTPFENSKSVLRDLENDFIYILDQYNVTQDTLKNNKSESTFLPQWGSSSNTNDEHNAAARKDQCLHFIERYNRLMLSYKEKMILQLATLSDEEIKNNIEKIERLLLGIYSIENILESSEQKATLTDIIQFYEEILYASKQYQAQDFKPIEKEINTKLNLLKIHFFQFQSLKDNFYESIYKENQVDDNLERKMKAQMQDIDKELYQLKEAHEKFNKHYLANLKQLSQNNKKVEQFINGIREYANKLDNITNEIEKEIKIEKEISSFYTKIIEGQSLNIPSGMQSQAIGTSILLAMIHKHPCFDTLIKEADQIDVNDLNSILHTACKNGYNEYVPKLLKAKSSITIPHSEIEKMLQVAIDNLHLDTAQNILLNVNFSPSIEGTVALLNRIKDYPSSLPDIKQGWTQLILDKDATNLNSIRNCYQWHVLLIETLGIEQKKIDEKIQNLQEKKGPIYDGLQAESIQLDEKLNRILTLKEHMIKQFTSEPFDNPERLKQQISIWEEHIDDLYRKFNLASNQIKSEEKDLEVKNFEKAKSSFLLTLENDENIVKIQNALSQLIHFNSQKTKENYLLFTSDVALNAIIKSKKNTFSIILNSIEDENTRKDYLTNAMIESINHNNSDSFHYLLAKHPEFFQKNEKLIFNKLVENQSGNAFFMTFFSHIQVPVQEPYITALNQIGDNSTNGALFPIQASFYQRWVSDYDKVMLNQLRNVYLLTDLCEKEIIETSKNLVQRSFETNLPKETKAALATDYALLLEDKKHQLNTLSHLKQSYILTLRENKGIDVQRFENHLKSWDETLESRSNKMEKQLDQDHNYIRSLLTKEGKNNLIFSHESNTPFLKETNRKNENDKIAPESKKPRL